MKTILSIAILAGGMAVAGEPVNKFVANKDALIYSGTCYSTTAAFTQEQTLKIKSGDGFVTISLATGRVTYDNRTPDEAAISFWKAVELMFPKPKTP